MHQRNTILKYNSIEIHIKIRNMSNQETHNEVKDLHVIHELGRDQNAGDEQPMNIERVDGQRSLLLSKTIKINIGDDEARRATVSILKDPFKVAMNGDRRASEAMKD